MIEQQVEWVKCGEGSAFFCPLETANLSDVKTRGVYVIWQSLSRVVIYVGEGWIADRLNAHRNDPNILGHRGNGTLLVTWASVQNDLTRWGIERYLGELWNPLVSKQFQNVASIQVNLPQ
jgi:hypothetical protein